jgi:nucleotide-binding universal stress UspA family protein
MPARNAGRLKILMAVDGSKFSKAAVAFVQRLCPPDNAEIRVLYVVEPLDRSFYPELGPPFPASMADIERSRLADGEKVVDKVVQELQRAGYAVRGDVASGHVRSTIVEKAEKWQANLILLGSRGRTGLKRALLGSVSDYVARHAVRSVLIVHP